MADDGKYFFETDEPGTWSNVLSYEPITEESLRQTMRDMKEMAGKPLPLEAIEPTVVMPVWVLEMAVTEGWVDEHGRFTEKYWKDLTELNHR